MKNQINLKFASLFLIFITAVAWRLFFSFGHSPLGNFTPFGAIALFGGYYFDTRLKSFLLPLLSIWLSDLVLNYFVYFGKWVWFYDGFLYTYGSFALMIVIGRLMPRVTFQTVLYSGVSAALVHWIVSDFGVWVEGRMYPKTWQGFVTCYAMAIPYLKNMLVSNLIFGAAMFGGFEWLNQKYKLETVSLFSKK